MGVWTLRMSQKQRWLGSVTSPDCTHPCFEINQEGGKTKKGSTLVSDSFESTFCFLSPEWPVANVYLLESQCSYLLRGVRAADLKGLRRSKCDEKANVSDLALALSPIGWCVPAHTSLVHFSIFFSSWTQIWLQNATQESHSRSPFPHPPEIIKFVI